MSLAQGPCGQAAVLALRVGALLAEQVGVADGCLLQGVEGGQGQVGSVDERQQLLLVSGPEVEAALQALEHEVVVVVPGSVDAGGAEDDVRQPAHGQLHLGLELGGAVAGVGDGRRGLGEGGVALLVALAEHRQRAHVEELAGHGPGLPEGVEEGAQVLVVDAVEVLEAEGLGGPQVVYDVVPAAVGHLGAECLGQRGWVRKVEDGEVQARVGEVSAGRRLADAGPYVEAASEGRLGEVASHEAAGAYYQQFLSFHGNLPGHLQLCRSSIEGMQSLCRLGRMTS